MLKLSILLIGICILIVISISYFVIQNNKVGFQISTTVPSTISTFIPSSSSLTTTTTSTASGTVPSSTSISSTTSILINATQLQGFRRAYVGQNITLGKYIVKVQMTFLDQNRPVAVLTALDKAHFKIFSNVTFWQMQYTPIGYNGTSPYLYVGQINNSQSWASLNLSNNISIGFSKINARAPVANKSYQNYQTNNTNQSKFYNNFSNLPACNQSNTQLSVSPLPIQNVQYIMPLGNLNPTGHVFPSDHIYFVPQQNSNLNIYAPGNVTVTQMSRFSYSTGVTDWTLSFSPCSNLTFYFHHMTGISVKLSSNFTQLDYCNNYTTGSTGTSLCGKFVSIKVKAGEIVGRWASPTVNGASSALDLGGSDFRTAPLIFANASRYFSDKLHTICPIDYFIQNIKSQLYSMFGGPNGKRTTPPLCGQIAQDIPGTAQGDWFAKNVKTQQEDPNLALVHDNVNPQMAVFSVGTSLNATLHSGTYQFMPASSGYVNRDFSNVTSDGNTYCYSNFQYSQGAVIIIQMPNSNTLRIEGKQGGSCGTGPWSFDSNYVDFVR